MRYDISQLTTRFFHHYHDWMDAEGGRESLEYVHDLNDSNLYPNGFTSHEAVAYAESIHRLMDGGQAWLRVERHFGDEEGACAFIIAKLIV